MATFTVTGISATSTKTGPLKVGDTLDIVLATSETVDSVTGGTPSLALSNGATATYVKSDASGLHFTYTVQAGQDTADLVVQSLALNEATVTHKGGTIFTPDSTLYLFRGGLVELADVDNNGTVDLISASSGLDMIQVLYGTTNGSFFATHNYAAGDKINDLVVGDVNKDGRIDIVTASGDGSVSVLLGGADGEFGGTATYGTPGGNNSVVLADVNKDGNLDIVTANMGEGSITVLEGNGDGTFQAPVNVVPTGVEAYAVAVADVNKDGNADLILANGSEGTVSVYLGQNGGGYGTAQTYATANYPTHVAAADLNGDGYADLVTANGDGDSVTVLMNTGAGGFTRLDYATGSNPEKVLIADVDGDGTRDLVTANYGGSVSVLRGNGDGTFQAHQDYATLGSTMDVAAADVDLDGDIDLVSSTFTGRVVVFKGSTTAPSTLSTDAVATAPGHDTQVVIDTIAPILTSLTTNAPNTTNATSLTYTVMFSEAVTGLDAADLAFRKADGTAAVGTIGTPTSSDGGMTWTVTVSGTTAEGSVLLDLVASGTGIADLAGNLIGPGGSTGGSVTLDHVAQGVLSGMTNDTGRYGDDFVTNTTKAITVSGTSEAGATVSVVLTDAKGVAHPAAAATVNAAGDWSFVTDKNLAQGTYHVAATVTDLAGNVKIVEKDFVVDRSVVAPVVTAIGSRSVDAQLGTGATKEAAPTIAGTAEPEAVVSVSIDGISVGTVKADALGIWSLPYSEDLDPLTEGKHTFTVSATDLAGNVSAQTTIATTIDLTKPTIGLDKIAVDNVVNAAEGAAGYKITGTTDAEVGQTVTVKLFDAQGHTVTFFDVTASSVLDHLTATVVKGVAGNVFSVDMPADFLSPTLADGGYTVKASVSDIVGNAADAATLAITVDETRPTISLDKVAGDDVVNRTEGQAGYTISGTTNAEIGQTVTVQVLDEDGNAVVVKDADGNLVDMTAKVLAGNGGGNTFSLLIPEDGDDVPTLADGTYTVKASVSDTAGNLGIVASRAFEVNAHRPTIALDPILADKTVNAADSVDGYTISGTTNVTDGLTVTVTIKDAAGHEAYKDTATVQGGKFSITVKDGQTGHVLSDGTYTVSADASDKDGNAATPATKTLAVDVTRPTVGLDVIATDDILNSAEAAKGFVISGVTTAEAGQTVTIQVIGTSGVLASKTATVVAGENGGSNTFSLSMAADTNAGGLGQALANGAYTVTAAVSDLAGNPATIAQHALTVDEKAPGLTVYGLKNGLDSGSSASDGITNVIKPLVLEGYIENGSTLKVVLKDKAGATTDLSPVIDLTKTIGDNVYWSAATAKNLPEGTYTVEITATDAAGNHNYGNPPPTIVVDRQVALPKVTGIGHRTDIDATGYEVHDSDATPTITGTAEAHASVSIIIDDQSAAYATADADGKWSLPYNEDLAALEDGTHTIKVVTTDLAGNISAANVGTFVTDTTAPSVTLNTIATDDIVSAVEGKAGYRVGGVTTAEIGQTVTVTIKDAESKTAFETTTVVQADNGAHIFYVELKDGETQALANGTYTVSASVLDKAGNPGLSLPHTLTVNEVTPKLTLDTISTDDIVNAKEAGEGFVVSGTTTAEAGQSVLVMIELGADFNYKQMATVVPGLNGTNTFSISVPNTVELLDGTYTVTAKVKDQAGNPADTVTHTLTVDTTAPSITLDRITGDNLINATEGKAGYGITGTTDAEVGQTVTVTVFDANDHGVTKTATVTQGSIVGANRFEVKIDADGTTPTLADGTYTVSATVFDKAGNKDAAAATQTLTVFEKAPTLSIDGLAAGLDTGASATDGVTQTNARLELKGHAEIGTTVSVVVTNALGVQVGEAFTPVVGGDGSWSIKTAKPLAEGTYTFTATATGSADNTTQATKIIVIDRTGVAPGITLVAGKAGLGDSTVVSINDPMPTIVGTAEAHASVNVTIDGNYAGTAITDGTGVWTLSYDADLGDLKDGSHTIQAVATDLAGNARESAVLAVTVKTTVPATLDVALASDTGDATDHITSNAALTVTKVEAGAVVEYAVDGGAFAATYDATKLSDGAHVVTVRQTDAGGNVSVGAEIAFTLDTTKPVLAASAPAVTEATSAQGAAVSFTATAMDLGQTLDDVSFTQDGNVVHSGDVFGLGQHTIVASATDASGNLVTQEFSFGVVDTTKPVLVADTASGAGLAKALTGNVLANDSDVSLLHLTEVQAGAKTAVVIAASGTTSVQGDHGTLTIAADGSYSYHPTTIGQDVFTQTVVDAAGNAAQTSLTFDIAKGPNAASLSFAFDLTSASFSFGSEHILMTAPDGTVTDLMGVGTLNFRDGTVEEKDGAPLVDDLYYDVYNPDVWAAKMDADAHFAQYGWKEGRDPNASFSTVGYLAANKDVADAGVNPLEHYNQDGLKEGRDPSAAFDNESYLIHNPDVAAAGLNPLAHYLEYGQSEGRQTYAAIGRASDFTHGSFDAEYYLLSNTDVAKAALAAGGDTFAYAYQHYQDYGWHEGRNPNAYFNTGEYLTQNQDVAEAKIDPLAHYDQWGWREGRSASSTFDTEDYLAANPDVAEAKVDPLQHFLQYGAHEGRQIA